MQEADVIKSRKMIWVDGNTLVRMEGERIANEELYGGGYQAKLTRFIAERDRRYAEEEAGLEARRRLLEKRRRERMAQDAEPSC